MKYSSTILGALALGTALNLYAGRVAYFPMEIKEGQIVESVSGRASDINAATMAERIGGVRGEAVRFDGYSTFIESELALGSMSRFTFSVWCAMETWPIMEHDVQNETDMTCIAGNYDAATKSGMGFFVSRVGKLSFRFYSQGWPGEIVAPAPLPLYRWNNLVAVADGNTVSLYNNGELLGSAKAKSIAGSGRFMIGKSYDTRKQGPFHLNTINGIVDEIEIYDEALDKATIEGWKTSEKPSLSEPGPDKYADDLMRPRFHGMPSRNWTNECHGLIYHNGLYHVFFQKNANGPYMSRLQWGHIVSDNLYDWREVPIALGSDKWYDLKGCWSGCVVVDDVVTGGKPNIIYTGVDYARAMIGQAAPDDNELLSWTKRVNPIIDGRPAGLSDDFRDPYFFRHGEDAYLMVGTSKDGKGACTLHKYNPADKSWSNDGRIFFSASSVAGQGSFWEMPNLTEINGRRLFTVTPQGLPGGVKAIYWSGSVNDDGTFNPAGSAADIELPGFAKEGYGLLSPSIMQKDGKTIAIGIVPDKLPGTENYKLGWAHTYSLPREWSLDANGKLMQKPYAGLEAMRDTDSRVSLSQPLAGTASLGRMTNREAEIIGEFVVADAEFGLSLFGSGDRGVRLSYSPASGKLTLDMRSLERISNDANSFNGLYETTLPAPIAKGSTMKIHVFVDHSIVDIFINDRWASSVRVFPTAPDADGIGAFSDGGTTQANISVWSLKWGSSGIDDVFADNLGTGEPEYVNVYSLCGDRKSVV